MKHINIKIEYCNDCPNFSIRSDSYTLSCRCNRKKLDDNIRISKLIFVHELNRGMWKTSQYPNKVKIPDFCELPDA